MNEDQNKPQIGATPPVNTDSPQSIVTDKKPRFPGLSNAPQKPVRTLESDMAEAMARMNGNVNVKKVYETKKEVPETIPIKIPVNIPSKSFGNFISKPNSGDIIHVSGNAISGEEDHPLHVLNNQVEPKEKKVVEPVEQTIDISKKDTFDLKSKFFNQFNFKPKTPKPIAVPKPVPPPPPPPPVLKQEPPRDVLRTYEGDVAKNFSTNKPTVVTMAIAESKRQGGGEAITNRPIVQGFKKATIVLLSVLLISLSIGGLTYLYIKIKKNNTPVVITTKNKGIMVVDNQKNINIQSLKKNDLSKLVSSEISAYQLNPGKISEIVLNINTSTSSEKLTAKEFIDTLRFTVSDAFRRAITEKWMLGIYSDDQKSYPFLILKTDFFENTFSGMLRWEPYMSEELADVFNYRDRLGQKGSFVDRVIQNRDIREYIARNGETLLIYTFIDKDTVLITTSEAVVPTIIDRIEKQSYVR